jgi:Ni,Fe-hydrogenase I cytochrome b subunit
MSDSTRILAGILLLSLVTVETGGLYLVRLWRSAGRATPFQIGFARAGHAHAGVLLILALTGLLYADAVHLTGPWGWV